MTDTAPTPTVNVVALNTTVAQPGTSTGDQATHMVTLSNGTNLFFHEQHIPIALRDADGNIILGVIEGISEDDLVTTANKPAGSQPVAPPSSPAVPPLAITPPPDTSTPPPTDAPPAPPPPLPDSGTPL